MNRNTTIHALFEKQVHKHPHALAIQFQDTSISYDEFNRKTNQLAHYLKSLGIQSNMPIALAMERGIEQLIAIFAILKAGGAYVPLDPSYPESRLLIMLNSISFLITHPNLEKIFAQFQGNIVSYNEKNWNNFPGINLKSTRSAHNLAYIIYTSGSTGTPKGVMIEHGSVVNYILGFSEFHQCYQGQRVDYSSNYAFDMAISNTLLPLALGLSIIICDETTKKDLRDYLQFLQKNKINLIKITPSYFRALLYETSANPMDLPDLQLVILGGEKLGTQECKTWLNTYPKHAIINEYGPTETTVAVSSYRVTTADILSSQQTIPIGKPGNNINFYLLNKEKKPVNYGEIGELYIGGVCLARGYFNLFDIDAERFITVPWLKNKRLYKTGDLCTQHPNQIVEYIGRIDHQIKIRGFRVETSDIQHHLLEYPGIKDTIVVAHETTNEKQLVAYYILAENYSPPDFHQLRNFLKTALPDHMIPMAFIKLEQLPLNANGKLDREALPMPQFLSLPDNFIAPKTSEELNLVKLWQEELGIDKISMNADFFELGGHSLIGARIISRVRQTFTKDIHLNDLYRASTPGGLIKLMQEKSQITSKKTVALPQSGPLPLSDFQFVLWLSNSLAPKLRKLNLVERKRFQGTLNIDALSFSFKQLFIKHEILGYRIYKWKPAQIPNKIQFTIAEKNLSKLTRIERELKLLDSMDELIKFYPWPKRSSLMAVRLFYLDETTWELQLCISHIISDQLSVDIVFSDLSDFYQAYEDKKTTISTEYSMQYKDYIQNEYQTDEKNLRAFSFWTNYLNDVRLFNFPEETIVKPKLFNNVNYSTYIPLPEAVINKIQFFCIEHHVNVNDALCAALAVAITPYADMSHPSLTMNMVKSTRDNPIYDSLIGCFLRIEPVKLLLDKEANLLNYTKQIHDSLIITAPYQTSSILTKLTALNLPQTKISYFTKKAIQIMSKLYLKLFPNLFLHTHLATFLEKLTIINKRERFIIHVNLWNNFLSIKKNKQPLFNMENINLSTPRYDLVRLDYLLDVCFMRENNGLPFIVISSNLKPEFRTQLGQDVIHVLDTCLNIDTPKIESTDEKSDLNSVKTKK